MNNYVKSFLHRGLIFGGFGPIVVGTVIYAVSLFQSVTLSAGQMLVAIVSGYFLAFIQAGASVFNQIEEWPIAKSLLCHLSTLYFTYVICYLANSWIAFEPIVILIFTAIFLVSYFVIWLSVFFSVRAVEKKLHSKVGN